MPEGLTTTRRCDFAFLSLARDCAPTIPRFLDLLAALRSRGLSLAAFVGENGSRDGTRALLERAEAAGQLVLVPTAFMAKIPDRLARMALGRERIKMELDASRLEPRIVCVLDLDNVLARPPSATALIEAAAKLDRPGIFGVSATSRPHYYDLLAFQDEGRSFETLLDDLAASRGNIFSYYRFFRSRIYPHQQALTDDREIACASSFNGLCLYRAEVYRLGSYLRSGRSICEHLVFNRRLAEMTGAKMLIDPGLVLPTPIDHSEQSFLPFAWRRLRKLMASRSPRGP
ncbi:glycosyltransferase family 2 protein [Bosea sp. (in: a-proteobacteria)]|uniref:glycosyltransferase family 2 protein n=1 Tax=Bosea sp. (in: a-proteobacteria) TaxID=1871050 RepID=UPI002618792D|nr:glycosyltransferase family 2 protein [Bosea sp. (in: a-proteobacteria)]MCO5090983.1 glycosyltransferase family 2 protein [Bosea sp. (in: a-proteobacteria)]